MRNRRRVSRALAPTLGLVLLMTAAIPAVGDADQVNEDGKSFVRVATFSVYTNNADPGEQTVAEIVAASDDGNTLVYTDGELEQIGFVDIEDPAAPAPLGTVPVGGEPTSVDAWGDYALVGVNTSQDFVNVSGDLVVVDIADQTIEATIALAGQPDSLKVSPSGEYLAIVVENERDEDLGDGGIPQLPAGLLQVVELDGDPGTWTVDSVDLTGLAGYEPSDPEPEFVDINSSNVAAVSLQENDAIAVVDLETLTVLGSFDAGTVDLTAVDTQEDDMIDLGGSLDDVPREPDAVAWVNDTLVASANEGDLFGGSRGFSIFETDGDVVFDSGNEYEHLAVRAGHYPEGRSENKGSEPEGIAFGDYGDTGYLFVGSERGSFIGVYSVDGEGVPSYEQVLPGPLGPEGLLAVPERNLFVASGEEDDPTFGVRATIQLYELVDGAPAYPHILSADDTDGAPIPWSALSGLAADPADAGTLYAVWDSFYSVSVIFTIDVSQDPAVITDATTITDDQGDPYPDLDPEGIAVASGGGFWVVSEGGVSVDADDPANDPGSSTPNLLLHVASDGDVQSVTGLPAEIVGCREATVGDQGASRAQRRAVRYGFEGVTEAANGSVYVAQQREWIFTTPDCAGVSGEPGVTTIWSYDPDSGDWDSFPYELEPKPANASWVGLSEITALEDGSFMLIERDNRTGDWAEIKTLQRVRLKNRGTNEAIEVAGFDLIPAMEATNGWITDKPEGAAVAADGRVYVVTDNDGVDDWSGETLFLRLGMLDDILEPGDGIGVPPALVPPTSPPGLTCAPGCGKGNGGRPTGLIGNDRGRKNGVPFAN